MSIHTGRNLQLDPLSHPLHGRANYLVVDPGNSPLLALDFGSNGVSNLSPLLTINGQTVAPTFRYKGGNAAIGGSTWPAWDYGATLTESKGAGAAATLNSGSPLLGADDDSVKSNAANGSRWQAASSSDNAITTGDFVLEYVGTLPENTNARIFDSKPGSVAGYTLYNSGGSFGWVVHDGVTQIAGASSAVVGGVWYHVMLFGNRDENSTNGLSIFVNGVSAGIGNISTANGSLNGGSTLFTINDRPDLAGFGGNTARYAYMAGWERASWHQAGAAGPAEWATIAAERFYRLTGHWPARAKGTAAPTVATRASIATIDKIESGVRKLYTVGNGWMRTVYRKDLAAVDIKGYLPEEATTNRALQSEDLTTSWTKLWALDTFSSNAIAAPDKNTTADGIVADSTNIAHGVTQAVTLTAATYVLSVFAKAGNKNHLKLQVSTIANTATWFNLATGAIGTTGSAATAYIEDWGDGWYRCAISFTGTAAAHTIQLGGADNDNDSSYAGDGATVNTYLWGMQCAAEEYPSSYIATTTATVTRQADVLYYKGNDGNLANQQGTAELRVLTHHAPAADKYLLSAVEGVTVNQLLLYESATTGVAWMFSRSTEDGINVNTGGTTVLFGAVRNVKLKWAPDDYKLSVSNAVEATDTTAPFPPNDMDRIYVGANVSGSQQLGGVISAVKIYK